MVRASPMRESTAPIIEMTLSARSTSGEFVGLSILASIF